MAAVGSPEAVSQIDRPTAPGAAHSRWCANLLAAYDPGAEYSALLAARAAGHRGSVCQGLPRLGVQRLAYLPECVVGFCAGLWRRHPGRYDPGAVHWLQPGD